MYARRRSSVIVMCKYTMLCVAFSKAILADVESFNFKKLVKVACHGNILPIHDQDHKEKKDTLRWSNHTLIFEMCSL